MWLRLCCGSSGELGLEPDDATFVRDIRGAFWSFVTAKRVVAFVLWVVGVNMVGRWWGVYVCATALIGIWTVGTKRAKPGETSAYSIFNANGKALPGTLTPAQIESSLRHGTAPQPDGGDIADDHDTDLAEQEEQDLQEALRRSMTEATSSRGGVVCTGAQAATQPCSGSGIEVTAAGSGVAKRKGRRKKNQKNRR